MAARRGSSDLKTSLIKQCEEVPDKNLGECIQEQMKRRLGRGRKVVWGTKADVRVGDREYGVCGFVSVPKQSLSLISGQ